MQRVSNVGCLLKRREKKNVRKKTHKFKIKSEVNISNYI